MTTEMEIIRLKARAAHYVQLQDWQALSRLAHEMKSEHDIDLASLQPIEPEATATSVAAVSLPLRLARACCRAIRTLLRHP
jgi:hypothetical protein